MTAFARYIGDIGGDMHALDRGKLPYPSRGKPVEEFFRRPRIGAARVRIADIGGEAAGRAFLDHTAPRATDSDVAN